MFPTSVNTIFFFSTGYGGYLSRNRRGSVLLVLVALQKGEMAAPIGWEEGKDMTLLSKS